jgi:hypothetical protein
MPDITSDHLDSALTALGEQLGAAGEAVHLVVVGGSGLLAIGIVSRPTRDVDVVAIERDGRLDTAEPMPEAVVAASALVARDLGLQPGWLNAGPTSLMDGAGGLPEGFADRLIARNYGSALRVSFASRVDQVFLKLYAYASRWEPRDIADLRQLDPTEDELRAAARWVRRHTMPGPFDDELARALGDLGVRDDGRDV